jgi:hypothetical protein
MFVTLATTPLYCSRDGALDRRGLRDVNIDCCWGAAFIIVAWVSVR